MAGGPVIFYADFLIPGPWDQTPQKFVFFFKIVDDTIDLFINQGKIAGVFRDNMIG
jgi:hypothetical protein